MLKAILNFDSGRIKPAELAVVLISVGQKHCQNEKMCALLKAVEHKFKSCVIVVGDTLQRHSLGLVYPHLDENDLLHYSSELGHKWRQAYSDFIHALRIPSSIVSWQDILAHPVYQELKEQFEKQLNGSSSHGSLLKDAISETADQYLRRFVSRQKTADLNFMLDPQTEHEIRVCSERYLIEECIFFAGLVKKEWPLPHDASTYHIVYANKALPAFFATSRVFTAPEDTEPALWISSNFRKVKTPRQDKQYKVPIYSDLELATEY